MKLAIIGSGISGLSAAYSLSKKYKVDLFEKEDHFGGHSHTIDVNVGDNICLLYTSPSPRDKRQSRMPSSA